MNKLFFLAIFSILLVSCGESYLYKSKSTLSDTGWNYNDVLTFNTAISDTNKLYNLYLDIEHTADYPFQNIYMNIYTVLPNGDEQKAQVNVNFAKKDGEWNGECNGNNCTIPVVIQENAYFAYAGDYTFKVEQFTRNQTLPNIKSLTFKIQDTGKTK